MHDLNVLFALCVIYFKYYSLINYLLDIDKCNQKDCLWRPYLLILAFNIVPVFIGSILVAYVEVINTHL